MHSVRVFPPSAGGVLLIVALAALAGMPASPPASAQDVMHEVQAGDDLRLIAGYYYGDTRLWDRIWRANRDIIRNPNRIEAGSFLWIPDPQPPAEPYAAFVARASPAPSPAVQAGAAGALPRPGGEASVPGEVAPSVPAAPPTRLAPAVPAPPAKAPAAPQKPAEPAKAAMPAKAPQPAGPPPAPQAKAASPPAASVPTPPPAKQAGPPPAPQPAKAPAPPAKRPLPPPPPPPTPKAWYEELASPEFLASTEFLAGAGGLLLLGGLLVWRRRSAAKSAA